MPVTLRSRATKSAASSSTKVEEPTIPPRKRMPKQKKTILSPFFARRHNVACPLTIPQPPGLPFPLQPAPYGLIQERIRSSLYALIVQAILWNQTRGQMARPVLFTLLATYPTPLALSKASLPHLTSILQPIGLHNVRATRLIALAHAWLLAPPSRDRRYRKLHYPSRGCGSDVRSGEVLRLGDERQGWEIAHLPGVGAYALDSYRIFYRDELRGVGEEEGVEPEWKRVVSGDKELKLYLGWRWEGERDGEELVGNI